MCHVMLPYAASVVPPGGEEPDPPRSLHLVGHPLRWRLLTELARSDRRVVELVRILDQPQSLISYHLRRLRNARLVTMRRSSASGRDAYYSVRLDRCAELLATAGGALHPALRLVPPTPPSSARRRRVLFLCTGNSARSQMAEALLDGLVGGRVEAFSAGSRPKPINPMAVAVMAARGLDLSGKRSKHHSEFEGQRFDRTVTVCDNAREICPEFDGPEPIHWSIPDPARARGSEEEVRAAFEWTANELETRIRYLLFSMAREEDAAGSAASAG